MQIILTGATGFVGTNLSKYLQENNIAVKELSLRENSWKENICENSDAIIHLAGKAHDTSNSSNPEEYFTINRDLTVELFDYFLESNIKDFFFFSSVKAAADTIEGSLTEEVIPHPLTPYGKSKLEAEQYLLSKILPKEKRIFIIRPCMIHGPGNKGNLNLLFNVVNKGIPWPLGSFENQRSFLSIDNLNFLIKKMLEGPNLKSGIFNFSDDKTLSTNELVELISSSIGKKGKVWKINDRLIRGIAHFGDKLSLPLNSERLKKLTETYIVSNLKIKQHLGLKELPMSVESGLIKTINSFKSNY